MLKKITLSLGLLLMVHALSAQNLQLHYDFGENRKHVTSTLEMFKPDKWGSTFFFVDFDYDVDDIKGVSLSYMEIARALKFWDSPFALQVEYNGGFGQFNDGDFARAYQINDAWLAGVQYTWNNADYTRIFTLQTLYKNIREKDQASFQITGVWAMHFMNRKVSFTGFADFWKEENAYFGTDETTDYVFLAEPQLWYNFSDHFSAGSEIELATNFAGTKGFKVNPTLALKWNF
ncbi:MAG: DUF5020 family protein [Bacteroidales bacterium]